MSAADTYVIRLNLLSIRFRVARLAYVIYTSLAAESVHTGLLHEAATGACEWPRHFEHVELVAAHRTFARGSHIDCLRRPGYTFGLRCATTATESTLVAGRTALRGAPVTGRTSVANDNELLAGAASVEVVERSVHFTIQLGASNRAGAEVTSDFVAGAEAGDVAVVVADVVAVADVAAMLV